VTPRKKAAPIVAGGLRGEVPHCWSDHVIHFVDFEGSVASGILEFGVVTLQGGLITTTRTGLCAPQGRVRAEDTAVHGLDAGLLAGRRPFADEWEYFAGLRESGPLAAHYAGAENSLIKSVWPYPRRSPDFAAAWAIERGVGPMDRHGGAAGAISPELESGKLETLVDSCGLQAALASSAATHCPADRCRFHAALYDAIAGALLLSVLARDLATAGLSLPQLLTFSTHDGAKRDALSQGELF
jgi:DNA polymerase-3 subunit epsilon